jgi:hypothetical protein
LKISNEHCFSGFKATSIEKKKERINIGMLRKKKKNGTELSSNLPEKDSESHQKESEKVQEEFKEMPRPKQTSPKPKVISVVFRRSYDFSEKIEAPKTFKASVQLLKKSNTAYLLKIGQKRLFFVGCFSWEATLEELPLKPQENLDYRRAHYFPGVSSAKTHVFVCETSSKHIELVYVMFSPGITTKSQKVMDFRDGNVLKIVPLRFVEGALLIIQQRQVTVSFLDGETVDSLLLESAPEKIETRMASCTKHYSFEIFKFSNNEGLIF